MRGTDCHVTSAVFLCHRLRIHYMKRLIVLNADLFPVNLFHIYIL